MLEDGTPQHEVLLEPNGVKAGILAKWTDCASLIHGFTVCGIRAGKHLVAGSLRDGFFMRLSG